MGQPAARLGDAVAHDDASGNIIQGSPDVFIGGPPAARLTDKVQHDDDVETITSGSNSVFINGLPAARLTDSVACGGVIVSGCPTVLIG